MQNERKRSSKPIITFDKLTKPFRAISDQDVEGGINGKNFFFPKGKEFELDYPQWESLFIIGLIKVE